MSKKVEKPKNREEYNKLKEKYNYYSTLSKQQLEKEGLTKDDLVEWNRNLYRFAGEYIYNKELEKQSELENKIKEARKSGDFKTAENLDNELKDFEKNRVKFKEYRTGKQVVERKMAGTTVRPKVDTKEKFPELQLDQIDSIRNRGFTTKFHYEINIQ